MDNSEPPTPQDVKAHLQGGIPEAEILALKTEFDCYKGLQNKLFTAATDGYAHFADAVKEKADIKTIIGESKGKQQVADDYHKAIETFWTASDAEQYDVMPKGVISDIKGEIKELKAQKRELSKQQKALEKRRKLGESVADEAARCAADIAALDKQIADKEAGIAHHVALENELKDCRKKIREIEVSKEALADKAREQISDDDARRLITQRWLATLHDNIAVYLEAHARRLQQRWNCCTTNIP